MSRNRSMKTKKQRHGRRSSTKSAKPAAKPAPVPVSAKPEVDSTSLPKSSEKPTPGLSLVRRAAHQNRKLKAKIRLMEKKVAHYGECEKHLVRALQQLEAAKVQIGELNTAVHYLLNAPPHNGLYHDKGANITSKWKRTKWECPVKWNQQD
ncbi:hypothetical protein NEMBOFW57_006839 [Staphylotrichum longicolle]|uniref:Uncharacterized protein n=1 Tax=Staphylotrichum longicolle TaxID=669026 RepID=A0AAD4EUC3_9PEZI|nr:hypothetical protein NEMBOFW57_006839 [Staphylotrichum longicolle]